MEVKKYNPFVVKPLHKTKNKPGDYLRLRLSQSPRLNLKLKV